MSNVKKIVLSAVCIVILVVGIIGGKYLISVQKYKKAIEELKISNVDLSKVSDGKYTGSYDVGYVGAKVAVTVKNNKIVDITLLSHKNERGKPAEVIPEKVVKAQSLQVDTISGATNSSKVILKAIENALESGE
ncbi:FMN-binding protein [Clostridium kluyveri]|uniref:FMN-binding protein n=1 Tax=Clostridium kluyveri TaxID=1534 RepID=A0A1L5F7X7_CLOKL|nr:FMN-binding protein [Clostridium kluyveri]APM38920.1 FMN-binding protein [Clostridium kluyveri]